MPKTIQPTVNNVSELITALKAHTGTTTESAFENLAQLVGNTIKFSYEAAGKVESAEEETTADGKNVPRFAHLNKIVVERVILTSGKKYANFNNELCQQCNGLVLEYPSWKVLAMPAPMFNLHYKDSIVIKNIIAGNYTLYKASDGSTVTLYYRESKNGAHWRISSANGFDIGHYKFLGNKTYDTALAEVFAANNFSFDKLDKSLCYTIGFHHPDFHPFVGQKGAVGSNLQFWFIQSTNVSQYNEKIAGDPTARAVVSYENNCGIPLQESLTLPAKIDKKGVKELLMTNFRALQNYFTTQNTHYGYVLRGQFEKCSGHANVMLESSLMKKVRQFIYKYPQKVVIDRSHYAALRAYLGYTSKQEFINMFPQYDEIYKKYEEMFDSAGKILIAALRNKQTRNDLLSINSKHLTFADLIARTFISHLDKKLGVSPNDANTPSIIGDFLMDNRYLDFYCECIKLLKLA